MGPHRQHESSEVDLPCFSHLRWSFVFERPQHLLSRCARARRVFYIEEPVRAEGAARLVVTQDAATVVSTSIRDVVRPHSPFDLARIADTPSAFVAACEAALAEPIEKLLVS